MQTVGFLVDSLFIISAALFNPLQKPGTPIKVFQSMYFFSFWSEFDYISFGSRSLCGSGPFDTRGILAGCDKLGALVSTITSTTMDRVLIRSCWFHSHRRFIPDTAGLDLREQERY
jgi:hypothetical protein